MTKKDKEDVGNILKKCFDKYYGHHTHLEIFSLANKMDLEEKLILEIVKWKNECVQVKMDNYEKDMRAFQGTFG